MSDAALSGPRPTGVPRDLVFISYSHADKIWLERLRIFLKPFTRQNIRIWLDPYIEAGDDWRREIATALVRTNVGVALVSANFLASDFIYDEELPALLAGADAGQISLVPIPISASGYKETALARFQFAYPPDNPLDGLPENERNAALVKIAERIAAAARKTPSPATTPVNRPRPAASVTPVSATGMVATLHGVPGQRPNYLRRQEYLDALKQAVLGATDQTIGITGTTPWGTRIGLHGMGGIGKTVLAIDLINDDEVRRTFPDGIFWLTLGQTIEPLRLQGELAGYIVGEAKAFGTVNEARDRLRELFDGKSCLLVLDDLWRLQDAEPFDVLGPRSRLLVTTRDADLLVALGARELPLDVLSEDLALELLASWSGRPRAELPEAARKVAEDCGYLPLALALAGARVQGGTSWDEVLSALERGRLEFLDHPYGSVFSSLRLSTDALTPSERERYFELAVFPEDADLPVTAICTLWRHTARLEPDISRDLLRRLHRRAFLTLHDDGSGVSLHDLQQDFLRLNIASLIGAHDALIEAYRRTAPSGWANGPDDGYFFQYLPQHLAGADRLHELRALLCDYDWLDAKLRVTNISSVLADYDLVAKEPDLAVVQQALRLSIPALLRDRSQLPGQLLGRLRGAESPQIDALLAGAEKGPGRAWLRPRFASLTPPGGPLRQILVGHTDLVSAAIVLADGRRVLSGSWDNTLRLWCLTTGETLRTLVGHTDRVLAVAVLPDGSRALSGSDDTTLRLWDLETGKTLRTFEGHTEWVTAVAALADGTRALSGSADNTLRLWDLATGETLRTFNGHTDSVTAVAVFADGSRALSGSQDNTLRLWDLATGETLHTLEGHIDLVSAVAVLGGGNRAISGSEDKTLRLWDLATGETLRTLEEHTGGVTAVAVLANGSRALSGSQDRTVRLWDLATGKILRRFGGHTNAVAAVAVGADESRVVSGSMDCTLRLWDLNVKQSQRSLDRHSGWVTAVAVSPDGSRALTGSDDHTLILWDLVTGKAVRTLEGHTHWVTAAAVLPDGGRALTGSYDKTLRLWDLETGETLRTLAGHSSWVMSVALLPDGGRALSGSNDYTLRLWDLETGETLRTLEGNRGAGMAVAVTYDGSRAISASPDKMLRLWDLATGEILCTFQGHDGWVTAVAVPADGGRAISGSNDGTLRLWNLETGETLRTLTGHTGRIEAVALLADGSRTVSGSDDNSLRLWDLATGDCHAVFTAEAAIDCVAVTCSNLVVAGSRDGRIHIIEIREN
jgi:WD40 repeat protein